MFLLCLIFLIFHAFAEKFSGHLDLKADNGFSFMSKFCFQYEKSMNDTAGTVTIKLSNDNSDLSPLNFFIVLYDDQDNSWNQIYDTSLTCEQKASTNYARILKGYTLSNQTMAITLEIHEHIRPRWWWVYVVNCNSSLYDSFSLSYHAHFIQTGQPQWNKEAGVNDRGLNTMYLFYLIVYIFLFAIQLYAYQVYKIQQYIHQIVKLLTAAVGLQLFGVLFHFVDWMVFTENGKQELFFEIISSFFDVFAATIFLLLLLVLSQGWTISRVEIAYPKLTVCSCIVIGLFQCGFYIWRFVGLDPETTVYFYNSPPEWCYAALFLAIGIVFDIFCTFSILREQESNKKKLYLSLALFFSIWFFEPLIQIPIGDSFDPWVRDVAMDSISLTWNTITFIVMMFLFWPTWAHQFFVLSTADTQERILSGDTKGGYKNL